MTEGVVKEMLFGRNKIYLGIDIGSSMTKIVQVSKVGSRARITNVVSFPTPDEAFNEGIMVRPELFDPVLKRVLKEERLYPKQVFAVAAEKHVITRQVKIPPIPDDELPSFIQWQASKYIPFSGDELVLDYINLGKEEDEEGEKLNLLIIALSHKIAYSFSEFLFKSGFQLKALETVHTAVQRCICRESDSTEADNSFFTAVADMGASGTNIIIYKGNLPVFSRNLAVGGRDLTDALSRGLGIGFREAEKLKIEKAELFYPGQNESGDNEIKIRSDSILRPVLMELVREIRRCLDFVALRWQGQSVKELYLTGGTAMLKGISPFLSEQLEVPAKTGDPAQCLAGIIDIKTAPALLTKLNPVYAVAMGLAMREVVE